MPLHSTLSGSELHEPKGADAASSKQVYISDGAGSGSWTDWPLGFGFYEHSLSGQVIDTTESLVEINGLGSQTNETYLPRGIRGTDSLWDTTNYNLVPMGLGDAYLIRLTIPIASKTGSPAILTLDADIGGDVTPTTVISSKDISTDNTAPFNLQFTLPVFIGSTALSNGVQFFCSTDSGSVTLDTGSQILINRISSGDI